MAQFNKIKVGSEEYDTWSTYDLVEDIRLEIINHVENPDTVTAVASEIASGKHAIAAAINAKGGSASATESFTELAQDIQDTPTSGVLSGGIVQSAPFSFMDYVCKQGAYPFTEIDDDSVTVIDRIYAFYRQTALLKVTMNALTTISGGSAFQNCSALQEVDMPNLVTISGNYAFTACSALQEVVMPNLTTIGGGSVFYLCTALQEVVMPNLTTIGGPNLFYMCTQLRNVTFGIMTSTTDSLTDAKPNLRNITIGQNTNINLPFNQWTATNVIAEGQSGIDELNSNIMTNLVPNLYLNGGKTLRLGAALYDVLTTATKDAITNRGWTLQRG